MIRKPNIVIRELALPDDDADTHNDENSRNTHRTLQEITDSINDSNKDTRRIDESVTDNSSTISTNTSNISTNASGISANSTLIGGLTTRVNTLESVPLDYCHYFTSAIQTASAGAALIFNASITTTLSGFSPTTGIFTAPSDGVYRFNSNVYLVGSAVISAYSVSVPTVRFDAAGSGSCLSLNGVVSLTAGQTLKFYIINGSGSYLGYNNYVLIQKIG